MSAPRIFLIDTCGFIFRAYHARARTGAPPMRTTSGLPTEAVFIFSNMLRKLSSTFGPEYIAAVFESEGKTHPEEAFAAYKANRSETPPELLRARWRSWAIRWTTSRGRPEWRRRLTVHRRSGAPDVPRESGKHRDPILLSKQLATIACYVPIDFAALVRRLLLSPKVIV